MDIKDSFISSTENSLNSVTVHSTRDDVAIAKIPDPVGTA